jgi:large subunit ribosomal protein L23
MPANVAPHFIIKSPLLSEKSTYAMNEQRRYTFVVDPRATKTEIKHAVQTLYKVDVVGINTQIRKGKSYRTRKGPMQSPPEKRATVSLKGDQVIELF